MSIFKRPSITIDHNPPPFTLYPPTPLTLYLHDRNSEFMAKHGVRSSFASSTEEQGTNDRDLLTLHNTSWTWATKEEEEAYTGEEQQQQQQQQKSDAHGPAEHAHMVEVGKLVAVGPLSLRCRWVGCRV